MTDLIPLDLSASLTDATGQLSKRSKRIYQNDAQVFANWMRVQGLTPSTLTRSHMIAYRAYLSESINEHTGKPYARVTAKRMFSVAHRILAEQVHAEKIGKNPADDIKGFKVDDETTHTALDKPQARELLASIDRSTKKGMRDYALITLLLRTGLRRFECSALNIEDIKQEQGHTIAAIQHGKGDKKGIVKLPVDVFRIIKEYIDFAERQNSPLSAPLFVGFDKGDHPTDKRIGDKTIERVVKYYGEQIGVPTLTPHGLRATFITLALEGGAQLHQVQYAARHADPRTTERYQKRKVNLDDNAVDYIKL